MWIPIQKGMASLKEMQEYYTMDDLSDMLECIAVHNAIEARARKE
jgi:hypothetical protein